MIMERLYGGFLCSMCDQPGRFGFVYVCTQDWEGERLGREGINQALNSAIERTVSRSTRLSSEIEKDSAPFPVEELNQSTKDAIARGVYTDEQIEILKEQKRHVVAVTRETLERIKEEESQPFRSIRTFGPTNSPFLTRPVINYEENVDAPLSTSDASSSSSSSDEEESPATTPITSSNSPVNDVDSAKATSSTAPPPLPALDGIVNDLFDVRVSGSKKRKTPPSPTVFTAEQGALDSDGRAPRIFPYCTFMCCPACRPTYRDRVWGRMDAYIDPSSSPAHPSSSVHQDSDSAQLNTAHSGTKEHVKESSHSTHSHSLALSLSELGSDPFGPSIIPVDLVRNIGLRKPLMSVHEYQVGDDDVLELETPGLETDISKWDTAAIIRGDENNLPEPSHLPSGAHAGQTERTGGTDASPSSAEKQSSVARRSVVRESIRRKVREWIERRDSTKSVSSSSSSTAAASATPSDQRAPTREKENDEEEIDLGAPGPTPALTPSLTPSPSPHIHGVSDKSIQLGSQEKRVAEEGKTEVDITNAERMKTTTDEQVDVVPVGIEITEEAAEMKAPDLVVRI